MQNRRTLISYASVSFLTAIALLPSCSGNDSQTSTSSASASSGDVSSSGSTSSGMGGSGGNATGGNGGGGACTPGTTDFCYTGPSGTEIVGVCKAGIKTCNADGTYGACTGEITPKAEDCTSMLDEDCDGVVNNGCACMPNTTAPCYSGPTNTLNVGDCKAGTQSCNAQGTAYGPCIGEVTPQAESCTLPGDENCDGQINESGAGCACIANSTASCYSGPANTLNIGNCKAGIQTCNAMGTAYGPCVGEVVPATEDCSLPGDENCNGQINEGGVNCTCVANSTTSCYSGPAGTQGVGICKAGTKACNAQGTGYGPCVGEINPGTEVCTTALDENCNGQVNEGCGSFWSKSFGGTFDDDVYDVAVDSSGNIVMVGGFNGSVDFGGGALTTSNGNTDIFIVKFDPQGNHLWSKQYGANGIDRAHGVAIDALGNVVVSGIFQSTVDFGGGPVASVGGTHDIFVLALDGSGNYLMSRAFGGSGGDEGSAVAFDSASNVILVGHMTGTIDFGGGALTSAGGDDGFIAKFSSLGIHQWSKRFGDANLTNIKDVAVDSAGNAYFTGNFTGQVDFGGGLWTSLGSNDSFLVKYSSAGAHVWSRQLGGQFVQYGWGVAVDSQNNVLVTGEAQGAVDFGLGAMTNSGNGDVFVAKYNSANTAQWAKLYGDASEQSGQNVKTDAQNNVIVVGKATGAADFGGGLLTSAGLNDAFVAKFNGSATHSWSRMLGDPLEQMARGVAVDNAGNIIVVGRFQGTVNFGPNTHTSNGGQDGFIVKYGP